MNFEEIEMINSLIDIEGKPDYREFSNISDYIEAYYEAFKKSDYYFRNFSKFEGCPNHEDYSDDQQDEFIEIYNEAYEKSNYNPKNWLKFDGAPDYDSYENKEKFTMDYNKALENCVFSKYTPFPDSPNIFSYRNFEDFVEDYKTKFLEKIYKDFEIEKLSKEFRLEDYPEFEGSPKFEHFESVEEFLINYFTKRYTFFENIKSFPGSPEINDLSNLPDLSESKISEFIINYNSSFKEFMSMPYVNMDFIGKPDYYNFEGSREEYSDKVKLAWEISQDNPKNWEEYDGCPNYDNYDDIELYILDYNRGYYALPQQIEMISMLKNCKQRKSFKKESEYYSYLEKILNKQRRRIVGKINRKNKYRDNNRAISNNVYNSYEIRESFMRSDFGAIMGNSDVDSFHNKISYENCLNGFINIKGTVGEGTSFHPIITPFKDEYVYRGGFKSMIDNLDLFKYEKELNPLNGILFQDIIFENFDFDLNIDIHTIIFNRSVIIGEINPIFFKSNCFEFCQNNCDFIIIFLTKLIEFRTEKSPNSYFRIIDCNISKELTDFINENTDKIKMVNLIICFNQCILNTEIKEGKKFEKVPGTVIPKCSVYQDYKIVIPKIYEAERKHAVIYNSCVFENS